MFYTSLEGFTRNLFFINQMFKLLGHAHMASLFWLVIYVSMGICQYTIVVLLPLKKSTVVLVKTFGE